MIDFGRELPGGELRWQMEPDVHGGVAVVGPDLRITEILVAFDEEWGCSSEELIGLNIVELLDLDDSAAVTEAWKQALGGPDGGVTFRVAVRSDAGRWRKVEGSLAKLVANAGHGSVVFTVRNLVKESERDLFEALVANSMDPIRMMDADGKILAARAMLGGRTSDELVGTYNRDWIHPDDVKEWDEGFAALVRNGHGTTVEMNFRGSFSDGYRWLEARLTNLLQHPAVGAVVASARDITERIEAERRGRADQEWFEALLATSPGAIRVLDAEGIVTFAQPTEGGRSAEELVGRLNSNWLHPEDVPLWDEALASVSERGHRATAEVMARGRYLEGYRWAEIHMTNLLDHDVISGIVINARDVTGRREMEDKLEHLATHDALTGLANRVLLTDRLDHALARTARQGGAVAVMFMDLDQFKAVNDTGGHDIGDQLLIEVAGRLGTAIRDSDTLARMGGDEFVVLAEDVEDMDAALLITERIAEAIRGPIPVDGVDYYPTASIGIALAVDGDHDAASLMSHADAAMYQAKSEGRDRIETFDATLQRRLHDRMETEGALRYAIENDELRVHYQPIMETGTSQIHSSEALVRWEHPERGLLSPGEFIPIAEETGLIIPMDFWVLHAACRQVASWDEDVDVRLSVSTNLSARHLVDPLLSAHVEDALRSAGIDASRLCIEITETALISHPKIAEAALRDLHALGVSIALDDFGTGYSSLTHLRHLPLDRIKIDHSFTAGLGVKAKDTTIIQSTIKMAHDLGLEVVAEGVETDLQLALLQTYGCDFVQGFYFGKGQPPGQIARQAKEDHSSLMVESIRGA